MERQNGGKVAVAVFPAFQAESKSDTDQSIEEMGHKDADTTTMSTELNCNVFKHSMVMFASEFLGTFMFLFIACMGTVEINNIPVPHMQVAFSFGLAILICVQCFGHISGAHVNPIITLASLVLGNTAVVTALVYLIAQILGALAGLSTLLVLSPDVVHNKNGVCAPEYHENLHWFQALVIEFIATCILIFVCCAVWDRRNSDKHDSVAARFGFVVVGLATAVGPMTGCNINPARSLAPAILHNYWDHHWVYWIGPILGSLATSVFYRFVFNPKHPAKTM